MATTQKNVWRCAAKGNFIHVYKPGLIDTLNKKKHRVFYNRDRNVNVEYVVGYLSKRWSFEPVIPNDLLIAHAPSWAGMVNNCDLEQHPQRS